MCVKLLQTVDNVQHKFCIMNQGCLKALEHHVWIIKLGLRIIMWMKAAKEQHNYAIHCAQRNTEIDVSRKM